MANPFFCQPSTTSDPATTNRLSVRDRRILRLHAEGRSAVEIACGLLCSVTVVRAVIEQNTAAPAAVTEHGVSIAVPEAEASAFLDVSSLKTSAGAVVAPDAPAAFSPSAVPRKGVPRGQAPYWTVERIEDVRRRAAAGECDADIGRAHGGKRKATIAAVRYRNGIDSGRPAGTNQNSAKAVAEGALRSVVRGDRRPKPKGGSDAPAPSAGRVAAPAVAAPVVPTTVPAVAARSSKAAQSSPGTAPPSKGLGPGADAGALISPAGAAPTAQAPAVLLRAVPLAEVAPCGCRWPVSQGRPHLFCNAPAVEGRPYCAEHAAMATVPLLPRRMFNPDRQLF